MEYEGVETVTLNDNEACNCVQSINQSINQTQIKKFMLNKLLPVAAHITALLVGLGIVIAFSYFAN